MKALVVWGGWDGHQPGAVAGLFGEILEAEGFQVRIEDTLDAFLGPLKDLSLIVPVVTMATITLEQLNGVVAAVRDSGVGLAGCHGGMCDSFREATDWQFMTGGQWVAHPGDNNVRYWVRFTGEHEITTGLADFEVVSEQYYLHTDPGNQVLAYTEFPHPGIDGPHVANACQMPQLWTKMFGKGRVFYNALGHDRAVLEAETPRELMRRGFLWAARS